MIAIIDNGTANSYCNQFNPPPAVKATNAGAPNILFVEHWVAKIEIANLFDFWFLDATK